MLYSKTFPSKGWIVTSGSNGKKEWDGDFLGDLSRISFEIAGVERFYVGVEGFFGIKIYNPTEKTNFIGIAKKVKIAYWWHELDSKDLENQHII